MLLTLVDSLRCPAGHDESSLVLSVETWSGPRVSEGQLGCPVCHARYPIHGGEADFAGNPANVRRVGRPEAPLDAMRLAAQLSLSEPGGTILLTGRYGSCVDHLVEFADVTCLLVDAPLSSSPAAVNIIVGDRLPLVDGALRAAAVDSPRDIPEFLTEVTRCVRYRGRIVAHTKASLPSGIRLLARDQHEWVAEVEALTPTVPLLRARPV